MDLISRSSTARPRYKTETSFTATNNKKDETEPGVQPRLSKTAQPSFSSVISKLINPGNKSELKKKSEIMEITNNDKKDDNMAIRSSKSSPKASDKTKTAHKKEEITSSKSFGADITPKSLPIAHRARTESTPSPPNSDPIDPLKSHQHLRVKTKRLTLNSIRNVVGHYKEIHNAAFEGDDLRLLQLLDGKEVSYVSSSSSSSETEVKSIEKSDPNELATDLSTPLHLAALQGHLNCVKLLIKKGAKVNACDAEGSTPLHNACFNNHHPCVRMLLANGAQVNAKDHNGSTSLHKCAYNNSVESMQFLLSSGVAEIVQDKRGFTPLHHASLKGHYRILEELLCYNKSLEFLDTLEGAEGNNALHLAGYKGSVECLKLLIEHKSNLLLLDKQGNSVLHKAAFRGESVCVEYLLNLKPIMDNNYHTLANVNGDTPLHFAAVSGNEKTVQALLKARVNIYAQDLKGMTALHNAAIGDHLGACQLILEYSAIIDGVFNLKLTTLKNNKQQTALDLSTKCGKVRVSDYLRSLMLRFPLEESK